MKISESMDMFQELAVSYVSGPGGPDPYESWGDDPNDEHTDRIIALNKAFVIAWSHLPRDQRDALDTFIATNEFVYDDYDYMPPRGGRREIMSLAAQALASLKDTESYEQEPLIKEVVDDLLSQTGVKVARTSRKETLITPSVEAARRAKK